MQQNEIYRSRFTRISYHPEATSGRLASPASSPTHEQRAASADDLYATTDMARQTTLNIWPSPPNTAFDDAGCDQYSQHTETQCRGDTGFIPNAHYAGQLTTSETFTIDSFMGWDSCDDTLSNGGNGMRREASAYPDPIAISWLNCDAASNALSPGTNEFLLEALNSWEMSAYVTSIEQDFGHA